MHTGLGPGTSTASRPRQLVPGLALVCVLQGLLLLALGRGRLAPQGRNRSEMTYPPASHDLPPAMPVQLPAEGAVAHPSAFHRRDNAGHPEGEARLGIRPTQGAAPVGPVQELLGVPGLRWRQAMLGTEVSHGVVRGAIRRLSGRWLARGGGVVRFAVRFVCVYWCRRSSGGWVSMVVSPRSRGEGSAWALVVLGARGLGQAGEVLDAPGAGAQAAAGDAQSRGLPYPIRAARAGQ